MPIIVEDGTMPEGANSYAALDMADAYLVPRGLWPETSVTEDPDAGTPTPDAVMVARKESALLRATDYLNGLAWKGALPDWQRVMAWPRTGVTLPTGSVYVPDNTVPVAVTAACIEMAALVFGGDDPLAVVDRGGLVTSESHTLSKGNVDVIGGDSTSDSYTYAASAPTGKYYPALRLIEIYLLTVPGKARGLHVMDIARS